MSSSWTERQAQTGDLSRKSKEELYEILSRQEKILRNKKFVQSLPDKGKKISDFAEKVRLALSLHDETKQKITSERTELHSQYQQALARRQPAIQNNVTSSDASVTSQKIGHKTPDNGPATRASPTAVTGGNSVDEQEDLTAFGAMETSPGAYTGASLNSEGMMESDLSEAFQRVSLSESSAHLRGGGIAITNPFLGSQAQRKPHYIDILEKTSTTSKPKYRPNQSVPKSLGSLSASPVSNPLLLSVEARRKRDLKHLDDITSARQPLLSHAPAQLLSLEESALLQREHTRRYQEMQAALAAQKLSEGLSVSLGSYSPDGSSQTAYRDDHGVQESSEED